MALHDVPARAMAVSRQLDVEGVRVQAQLSQLVAGWGSGGNGSLEVRARS